MDPRDDRARARSERERAIRLTRLTAEVEAISAALAAYQTDFAPHSDVRLRPGFIRRAAPYRAATPASIDEGERVGVAPPAHARPPLTRLVHRRSRSLPLYLSAVFTTQCEREPGRAFVNEHAIAFQDPDKRAHSWARLSGMAVTGDRRTRHARMTRALVELQRARLVDITSRGSRRDFTSFNLLLDDGTERTYSVPRLATPTVSLPKQFFTNGWHLVLEPREIAILLVIMEMTSRGRGAGAGVVLTQDERAAHYGISGEVYEAIHELDEFGLLKVIDPMPYRRVGRVRVSADDESPAPPIPYRCQLRVRGLQRPALEIVTGTLERYAIAPRYP